MSRFHQHLRLISFTSHLVSFTFTSLIIICWSPFTNEFLYIQLLWIHYCCLYVCAMRRFSSPWIFIPFEIFFSFTLVINQNPLYREKLVYFSFSIFTRKMCCNNHKRMSSTENHNNFPFYHGFLSSHRHTLMAGGCILIFLWGHLHCQCIISDLDLHKYFIFLFNII